MFIFPYIGLDKAFRLGRIDPDASSLLPGKRYPTSESVSQHPSDTDSRSEQSGWSDTEPEDDGEEADEDDEKIERDNDSHLLLYIVCLKDSAKLARPSSLPPKSRNSTLRTPRAVLVKGLEGGGGGGGGGGSGEEGGEGGGPSRLRLPKDGIGSLPSPDSFSRTLYRRVARG